MPKDPQLRITLRHWFSAQSKYKSLREMATASAIPFNTLRGYFSGKRPTKKNLQRLAESTGLDLSSGDPSSQPTARIVWPQAEEKKTYAADGWPANSVLFCFHSGSLQHTETPHQVHSPGSL